MWSCRSSLIITQNARKKVDKWQGIMGNSVPCSCSASAHLAWNVIHLSLGRWLAFRASTRVRVALLSLFPSLQRCQRRGRLKISCPKIKNKLNKEHVSWRFLKSGTLHLPSLHWDLYSCFSMFLMQFTFLFICADKLSKAVRIHSIECRCYDICDKQIFFNLWKWECWIYLTEHQELVADRLRPVFVIDSWNKLIMKLSNA